MSRILAVIIALTLGAAGAAKIVDSTPARSVLAFVGVVEHRDHAGAIWATGALEIGLAAWIMSGTGLRASTMASAVLLACFCVVLGALATRRDAPSCGCLPTWLGAGSGSREAVGGIVRNVGLIGMCVLAGGRHHGAPRAYDGSSRPGVSRRGFTIVEVLVVIAVVSVMTALVLPSLGLARERAREGVALSGLRQTHASLWLYSSDFDGLAPFLATPGRPWEPFTVGGLSPKDNEYFHQRRYYVNLLYPAYSDHWEAFTHEYFTRPPEFLFARFTLTQGALALPAYWSTPRAPEDLSLYRPARLDAMAFPAAKGLLLDIQTGGFFHPDRPGAGQNHIIVGLGDGSAGARVVTPELDQNFVTRPYGSAPTPTLATRYGFLGRDF